ncbi:MAG: 4-hydroxy-tetrahydrodipicolinate reductase [Bacteroidales bacterium]|nr:4-hydroxy-tetrahydrodipicolinate reductase [Bacteroidales bacterium]
MNIALIGYGRMGHEIEDIALKRGHNIKLIIDMHNMNDLCADKLSDTDVAIEFTTPEAAFENISRCLNLAVPVVSGTTGWLKDYDRAVAICKRRGTSFIHSSNYSIGVNLLFRLNEELSRLMTGYSDYSVFIEEIHHTAKLDAPSGTAIALAQGIIGKQNRYDNWCFAEDKRENCIPVKSLREGSVPGTHIVTWDSEIDTISLRHEAKNRKGLAYGAVVAAEFIRSRKGIFTMNDVMGF